MIKVDKKYLVVTFIIIGLVSWYIVKTTQDTQKRYINFEVAQIREKMNVRKTELGTYIDTNGNGYLLMPVSDSVRFITSEEQLDPLIRSKISLDELPTFSKDTYRILILEGKELEDIAVLAVTPTEAVQILPRR